MNEDKPAENTRKDDAKVIPHPPRWIVRGRDTDEMEADEYRNG